MFALLVRATVVEKQAVFVFGKFRIGDFSKRFAEGEKALSFFVCRFVGSFRDAIRNDVRDFAQDGFRKPFRMTFRMTFGRGLDGLLLGIFIRNIRWGRDHVFLYGKYRDHFSISDGEKQNIPRVLRKAKTDSIDGPK